MAGLNFDNERVEVPCGNCGNKVKATLGGLKRNNQLRCPRCNQVTTIDTRPFERDVRELNDKLRKMGFK